MRATKAFINEILKIMFLFKYVELSRKAEQNSEYLWHNSGTVQSKLVKHFSMKKYNCFVWVTKNLDNPLTL